MSGLPSYDQHLLDRLNALKKSQVQIDPPTQTITPRESTPETDLSSRLRSLRNGSLSPSSSPAPKRSSPAPTPQPQLVVEEEEQDPILMTDDQTLEELLADLGPEDQWKLDPDDPADVRKLLDEARAALPRDEVIASERAEGTGKERPRGGDTGMGEGYLTRDLDMSVFTSEVEEPEQDGEQGGGENLEGESREIQDIVRKLMDEVAVEGDVEEDETSGENTLHTPHASN
ncbi:hypothetical protein M7I_7341 [Glarea lozoyensis 74030]|uniref:Uncharacterized protein n=1 Tax=Glarea lozoyensis (strain ATCC 74030 / MF5533) TaxID=1104152 RepID=H0EX16_GLAL7|nr:hypothetical protein M7I_7341 [Glarea lozoyensis 74030]